MTFTSDTFQSHCKSEYNQVKWNKITGAYANLTNVVVNINNAKMQYSNWEKLLEPLATWILVKESWLIMNTLFLSQFACCPLTSMFHERELYRKKNRLQNSMYYTLFKWPFKFIFWYHLRKLNTICTEKFTTKG